MTAERDIEGNDRGTAGLAGPNSAGQEILNDFHEFHRLFDFGHVAAILNDGEPRVRDGALVNFAAFERRDRVLASHTKSVGVTTAGARWRKVRLCIYGFHAMRQVISRCCSTRSASSGVHSFPQ